MPAPEQPVKPPLSAVLQGLSPEAARLLLQQQAENIPSNFRQQAQRIVRAHRPAGLPEHFQPKLMGSQWDDFFKQYQQQKQAEEAARPSQLTPQEIETMKRMEQERLAEMGRESCRELEQVLRQKRIDQLISKAWGIANPSIEHKPEIVTYDDETQDNRSQVIISREYTYQYQGYVFNRSQSRRRESDSDTSSSGGYHTQGEATNQDRAGLAFKSALAVWHNYTFEQENPQKYGLAWTEFVHGLINIPGGTGYQHVASNEVGKLMQQQHDGIMQYFTKGVKAYFVSVSGEGGFNKSVPIDHPDAEPIFFEQVMAAEEIKKERQSRKF